MNKLMIRTALAALFVAAPFAGASALPYAGVNEDVHIADLATVPAVDTMMTASTGEWSRMQTLDAQIAAAETNVAPSMSGEYDSGPVNAIRAQIAAVRAEAARDAGANGGELSAEAYQTLSAQLRTIQQEIYMMHNG
jgi:hypothetical protein